MVKLIMVKKIYLLLSIKMMELSYGQSFLEQAIQIRLMLLLLVIMDIYITGEINGELNGVGDYAYDIAVDSIDNIYVTGYKNGLIDGQSYTGSWDIFLSKFDSDGNYL